MPNSIFPVTREWYRANEVWLCQCCEVWFCTYGDWCKYCNKKLEEYFDSLQVH